MADAALELHHTGPQNDRGRAATVCRIMNIANHSINLHSRPILVAVAMMLGGCTAPAVTEDSPNAVTIRYDGIVNGIDDATAAAQRACARHGKTARLRETAYQGLGAGLRYAHFDCI